MGKLPGDYIAGFVDGEGCFFINFRRDVRHERKNKPAYFYWDIGFAIVIRVDDMEIIKKIKEVLNCGKISIDKRGFARYEVTNISDLADKIAYFFNKYRLRAKKRLDFILWKEALKILTKNQQRCIKRSPRQIGFPRINWSQKDINNLKRIKQEIKQYKSRTKGWKWLN